MNPGRATGQTGPKLTNGARAQVIEWLAAGYSEPYIVREMEKRGWPTVNGGSLTNYRKKHAEEIAAAQKARHESAINNGLALKEERVRRLADHAEALVEMLYARDEKGRLLDAKEWRETLDDIARECGGRRQNVDVTSGGAPLKLYGGPESDFSPEDV